MEKNDNTLIHYENELKQLKHEKHILENKYYNKCNKRKDYKNLILIAMLILGIIILPLSIKTFFYYVFIAGLTSPFIIKYIDRKKDATINKYNKEIIEYNCKIDRLERMIKNSKKDLDKEFDNPMLYNLLEEKNNINLIETNEKKLTLKK